MRNDLLWRVFERVLELEEQGVTLSPDEKAVLDVYGFWADWFNGGLFKVIMMGRDLRQVIESCERINVTAPVSVLWQVLSLFAEGKQPTDSEKARVYLRRKRRRIKVEALERAIDSDAIWEEFQTYFRTNPERFPHVVV